MTAVTLSNRQQAEIHRLLERESQTSLAAILRSVSAFLEWLADVLDAGSELLRRVRAYAHDIWQRVRRLFI
ncbi:hypothetical protein ACFYYR_13710 [Streptomyces sp. NPDC001922]|uniref:hypothetical protein n=1 Tax=unclassified Streptomyces TaxID=2593676 RepID=UPI00331AE9E0